MLFLNPSWTHEPVAIAVDRRLRSLQHIVRPCLCHSRFITINVLLIYLSNHLLKKTIVGAWKKLATLSNISSSGSNGSESTTDNSRIYSMMYNPCYRL
ncbi:hypothetical protein [uncultured Nostoc sp.]|uniref:hypothetical protein n=1 Tax=uncultured Nostoc sp. TaxID=340711 RepID=UPI0035CAE0D1